MDQMTLRAIDAILPGYPELLWTFLGVKAPTLIAARRDSNHWRMCTNFPSEEDDTIYLSTALFDQGGRLIRALDIVIRRGPRVLRIHGMHTPTHLVQKEFPFLLSQVFSAWVNFNALGARKFRDWNQPKTVNRAACLYYPELDLRLSSP